MLLSIDKIYLALDTALSTGADFVEILITLSLLIITFPILKNLPIDYSPNLISVNT